MSQLETQLEFPVEFPVESPVESPFDPTSPLSPSLALVGDSRRRPARRGQRGLVSAEWAMAIIAAVAIVGVVVGLITSGPVHDLLIKIIKAIITGAVTHI